MYATNPPTEPFGLGRGLAMQSKKFRPIAPRQNILGQQLEEFAETNRAI